MWLKYPAVYFILLIYSLHCTYAGGSEDEGESTEDQDQDVITPCDREIAKILCDNFKEKMCECAEKMPDDEKPIFYDCSRELVDTNVWIDIFDAVCDQEGEQVETAYGVIKCWNNVMNETVDQMENDVYPEAYFECRDNIFDEALDKASMPCQIEKGKKPSAPNPAG